MTIVSRTALIRAYNSVLRTHSVYTGVLQVFSSVANHNRDMQERALDFDRRRMAVGIKIKAAHDFIKSLPALSEITEVRRDPNEKVDFLFKYSVEPTSTESVPANLRPQVAEMMDDLAHIALELDELDEMNETLMASMRNSDNSLVFLDLDRRPHWSATALASR